MTNKEYIKILQSLQDWLYLCSMNGGSKLQREAIDKAIEALSQPEPNWIPVTERLPKKSVEVLTCDSVGTIEVRSLNSSYDGNFYWESNEGECERLSDAIAWKPLPEPYKGVTE